jgi:pimeloyl-ACP methyl ester carboxylesterase
MANDYVICVRDVDASGKLFTDDPGTTRYLELPEATADKTPDNPLNPDQAVDQKLWLQNVVGEASTGIDPDEPTKFGNVLVFIHGFNNSQKDVMVRHRQLKANLRHLGYQGSVVSFDWPSANEVLLYLDDRSKAKATALALVDGAITDFVNYQQPNCKINVHLLGHSTGAYVIREAFDDADDRKQIASNNWTVSQIMLISGDVSADSMSEDNSGAESIYRHCVRLTNYSNPFDSVLKLSNAKRLGMAPRVGRVGLPSDAPGMAVNVDCGAYYQALTAPANYDGVFCHAWQFGDITFAKDMLATIYGDVDRASINTRTVQPDGSLRLT